MCNVGWRRGPPPAAGPAVNECYLTCSGSPSALCRRYSSPTRNKNRNQPRAVNPSTQRPQATQLMYFESASGWWKCVVVIWIILPLSFTHVNVNAYFFFSDHGIRVVFSGGGTHLQGGASHLEEGAISSISWSQRLLPYSLSLQTWQFFSCAILSSARDINASW